MGTTSRNLASAFSLPAVSVDASDSHIKREEHTGFQPILASAGLGGSKQTYGCLYALHPAVLPHIMREEHTGFHLSKPVCSCTLQSFPSTMLPSRGHQSHVAKSLSELASIRKDSFKDRGMLIIGKLLREPTFLQWSFLIHGAPCRPWFPNTWRPPRLFLTCGSSSFMVPFLPVVPFV